MTLAMKAKLPEYTEEDKNHGIVLEVNNLKNLNFKLDIVEKCEATIELTEAGSSKEIIKTIKVEGNEGDFKEYLFNYEDMSERNEFYVVIRVESQDLNMRSRIYVYDAQDRKFLYDQAGHVGSFLTYKCFRI